MPVEPQAGGDEARLIARSQQQDHEAFGQLVDRYAGVIVNLALFFAWHVLWPKGWPGPFDWISAAIALASAIALFRFKLGVLPLLGATALVGLAVTLLR